MSVVTPTFKHQDNWYQSIDRTKRVKDARSEAQKEIDEYRDQKETEFKKFETDVCRPCEEMGEVVYFTGDKRANRTKHSSGNKKMEEDANKETETKLKEIQEIGKTKGQKVVDDLLEAVVNVHPEVPQEWYDGGLLREVFDFDSRDALKGL